MAENNELTDDAIRAALRELKQVEEDKVRVEALKAAIREGFDSGIYEGDVAVEMRALIRQRAAKNAEAQETAV